MPGGSYFPTYFETIIHTELPLNSIAELPPDVLGLYYHEYIHYLQNLTTTFGLLKTWQTYDRLRQLIVSVRGQEGVIEIPLKNDEVKKQAEYFLFLKNLEGDSTIHAEGAPEESFSIVDIKLIDEPLAKAVIPGTEVQHIQLSLSADDGNPVKYIFGETAVSESMAYLIESKFFKLALPNKYPYRIVKEIIQFIYPPAGGSEELTFALCDISLMHPFPGWAFFTLLQEMNRVEFIPKNGREVIDFGRKHYVELGWNIDKQLDDSRHGLLTIIDQLYGNSYYDTTREWFKEIIDTGASLREGNQYIMVDMFIEEKVLGKVLTEAWIKLGGPHCLNDLMNRYIKMPQSLQHLNEKVHPQHLRVAWQLKDFLLEGSNTCRLYGICNNSENNEHVDDRCLEEPWERVNDKNMCPFVVAWHYYGFSTKDFLLNGKIQIP